MFRAPSNLSCFSSISFSGPLFWSQKAVLLHSFAVGAIEWTKSGDGLITAGKCVIAWKKESSSWKMLWKSQLSVQQNLVSTTWSVSSPLATAAHQTGSSSSSQDISNNVFVFFEDLESRVVKIKLCHPRSVLMIQWRPMSRKDYSRPRKDVLLTFCLDGAVRLWSEIDSNQKSTKRSLHVVSVIEMNQYLKGVIEQDIFVRWATEVCVTFPNNSCSKPYEADCDWLVGVGPDSSLSFFSVHCFDDLIPLRFPRTKFWRKYKLTDSGSVDSVNLKNYLSESGSLLIKAIFWRNSPSGPPDGCSVLKLLDDNMIKWSRFSCLVPETVETRSLTHVTKDEGFLSEDSHMGSILQLSIHPCSCNMVNSASLDSNGCLLFWSFATATDCTPGPDMILDCGYKFIGKLSSGDLIKAKTYSRLTWVPTIICSHRFLLLGDEEGIDCIMLNLPGQVINKISYQKIFTIPFSDVKNTCAPDYLSIIPLASTCELPFTLDSFLVLAAWMKEFQVSAWKVVLQSDDGLPSMSISKDFSHDSYVSKSSGWKHECYFDGKRYLASVDLCAIRFPDRESFTCFAPLSPARSYSCGKCAGPTHKIIHKSSYLYQIVTGHLDGTVRLWRFPPLKSIDQFSDETFSSWELVGKFNASCRPVSFVGFSGCGTKIASQSKEASSESFDMCIWQFIGLSGGGDFILEDKISVNGNIVALKWSACGNGHSVLAVCTSNKLWLYSPRHSFDKPMGRPKWICIASSPMYSNIQDFVWGPGLRGLLVHEKHLSVLGQQYTKLHSQTDIKDNESFGDFSYVVCCETGTSIVKNLLTSEHEIDKFFEYLSYPDDSPTDSRLQNLAQVADEWCSSLPSYHPHSLLIHLFSGNVNLQLKFLCQEYLHQKVVFTKFVLKMSTFFS